MPLFFAGWVSTPMISLELGRSPVAAPISCIALVVGDGCPLRVAWWGQPCCLRLSKTRGCGNCGPPPVVAPTVSFGVQRNGALRPFERAGL